MEGELDGSGTEDEAEAGREDGNGETEEAAAAVAGVGAKVFVSFVRFESAVARSGCGDEDGNATNCDKDEVGVEVPVGAGADSDAVDIVGVELGWESIGRPSEIVVIEGFFTTLRVLLLEYVLLQCPSRSARSAADMDDAMSGEIGERDISCNEGDAVKS